MIVPVSEILRKARVAMDMNRTSEGLLSDGDIETLSLDELITSKIEIGARMVESRAPVWLLDSGKPLSGSISFAKEIGKGRGRMQLPDDFMRLITFKMSDWERAVTEPVLEGDAEYQRQWSRYAGIRGTTQKPVVAIVSEPTGQVLEFWSCDGGASVTLQRGRYLPMPKIKGDSIEICEKLVDAVAMMTASLAASTVGEMNLATALKEQAEMMMT